MDKPRPGGSRDDSRLHINMTREELMQLLRPIDKNIPKAKTLPDCGAEEDDREE